ncbi:MAG TPA: PPC domain-containing DNA-binding protein [Terriglobia bacterium]|nr:PPC domain-containing DNA-binding protein [Terriglobia bacterium]
MKKTICFVFVMLMLAGRAAPAAAQAVPDVVSIPSEIRRVVLIRLKYNTDLLKGLEQAVKDEKIKNAVILSGVGSVTSYHVHAVSNTTLPAQLAFTQRAGAMDLIAVDGYVLNGRIHAHITMTDDNKAFGGHLHEGTKVFTFAIVTLGVLDDKLDLSRFDDSAWR